MNLSNEILKPSYIMCNECKKYYREKEGATCKIYPKKIPKNVLHGNLYYKEKNIDICKYFEK